MNVLRLLLFSLFGLLVVSPIFGAPDLKSPPEDGIYDPSQILDEGFRIDIGNRIAYERDNRRFELFVLLFDNEPSQGARILAKQAGESWSKGDYWAVIYQVGRESEPNCLVGGDHMAELPPELLERTVRGSRNTALLVTTPQNRLEELVLQLSDNFGLLRIQAEERYKVAVAEFQRKYAEEKKKKEGFRAIAAVSGVVLLGLAFFGFKLWRKHLRKLKPMEFPATSPRRRLSAPCSGGGDVLVSYGRRR